MIRHPEGLASGKRIPTIGQPPDLLPTILKFLDVPVPDGVQGRSLWPLINGEVAKLHDYAFSGRFPRCLVSASMTGPSKSVTTYDGFVGPDDVAEDITVTDEQWSLILRSRGRPSELYNLENDPDQNENVIADNLDVAVKVQQALVEFMREYGGSQALIDLYSSTREEMVAPMADFAKRLKAEDMLYVMRDRRGTPMAFLSEGEAAERCACQPGELELEVRSFGWLREHDPRHLIYMDGLFHWVQDLG